jgi:hypothetical protein
LPVLHRVALIEANKEIRASLTLVLTSTGGMEVAAFCSIEDYLHSGLDRDKIQLLICADDSYKADHLQLAQPIFCYVSAMKKSHHSTPTIYLDLGKLPAFPGQVQQAYNQFIIQE